MAEGIGKIRRGLEARFVDGTWLGERRCVTGGHGAHATGNAGQWYPVQCTPYNDWRSLVVQVLADKGC